MVITQNQWAIIKANHHLSAGVPYMVSGKEKFRTSLGYVSVMKYPSPNFFIRPVGGILFALLNHALYIPSLPRLPTTKNQNTVILYLFSSLTLVEDLYTY
jgi:hypothetical protein